MGSEDPLAQGRVGGTATKSRKLAMALLRQESATFAHLDYALRRFSGLGGVWNALSIPQKARAYKRATPETTSTADKLERFLDKVQRG